jgi:hypothetical protein
MSKKCQFPLGNLVATEVLSTKSLDDDSQLGPKKILSNVFLSMTPHF